MSPIHSLSDISKPFLIFRRFHYFRSVLLPWVPVFSKGSMDAFLIKNILPKLQIAITKWDINPSRQELGMLLQNL